MSKTAYSYTAGDFAGVAPDQDILGEAALKSPNITTALYAVEAVNGGITFIFSGPLSAAEKSALDALIGVHPLAKVKTDKMEAIDARTIELIDGGFAFAGEIFSLSLASQISLLALDVLRNDPALVYPVVCNTLKDTGTFDLSDAATVHEFALIAVDKYRSYKDSGTALKSLVRAAKTVADVDVVQDKR